MNDDKKQKVPTIEGNGITVPYRPGRWRWDTFLAFSLVMAMLAALFLLVRMILNYSTDAASNNGQLDYYKQVFSVLLGAFGAWIGAGAAHFFGRENLNESSRSTEAALSIQKEAQRGQPQPERIKDLKLTAMNNDFMFSPDATKKDVTERLKNHKDFWFVPMLQKGGTGVLEDIIHARVFWDDIIPDKKLSEIIAYIETDPDPTRSFYRELHGASFFVKVKPDEKIYDVYYKMAKAVVGIVVDEIGKPTHCFTKLDLQNALAAWK